MGLRIIYLSILRWMAWLGLQVGLGRQRTAGSTESFFLAEPMPNHPSTVVSLLPYDDGLIIGPRYYSTPSTATTPWRQFCANGHDVFRILRTSVSFSLSRAWNRMQISCASCSQKLPIYFARFSFKLLSINMWKVAKCGLYRPDKPLVTIQTSNLCLCNRIENSNRVVTASTDDSLSIVLNTRDTLQMAPANSRAHACVQIKNLNEPISRS